MMCVEKVLQLGSVRYGIVVVCVASCCLAGCASPFSEFQSARLEGKGKAEITAHYSTVGFSGEFFQDNMGFQAGIGVTDNLDWRMRYERIYVDGGDLDHLSVIGFGPKVSMHKDQAAFYLPVGFAYGQDVETDETWEAHPTILTTYSASPEFEINISMKAMLLLNNEDGFNTRFAINMGFGIGPESLDYTFRPEAGVMFHTSGGDPFYHVGLGLSLAYTDKKRVVLAGQ